MKKLLSGQMPVPCPQWAQKLAAAHSNDLFPADRVALEQHVASCPDCAAVLAEYQEMDKLISHLPAVAPFEGLPPQLQSSLEEQNNVEYQNSTDWQDITISSLPPQLRALPVYSSSHTKRLTRAASAIAAVLVVGAILGSVFLLFQRHDATMGSANWNCPVPAPLVLLPERGSIQANPVLSQSTLYFIRSGVNFQGNSISAVTFIKAMRLKDGSISRTYQIAHSHPYNITVAAGVMYADVISDSGSTSLLYAIRASDGTVLWHHSIPQLDISRPPIVENGVIYLDTLNQQTAGNGVPIDPQGQYIYALHATNGSLVGKYKIGLMDSLLAVHNGFMYVQSGYALYVLQSSSGRVLWQLRANDLNHSPDITIADERVYVSAENNSIYILQASNGHLIHKITQRLSSSFEPLDAPLVADGIIYTKARGGYIYALQAADGSPLWCAKVKESNESPGSLAVANKMLYANTSSGQIDAFNASNGKLLWQFQTESSGFALAPIVQNGIVYDVTLNNTVYALRESDGKLLWQTAG